MIEIRCEDCTKYRECSKGTTPGSTACLKLLGVHPDNLSTRTGSTQSDNKQLMKYLEDTIQLERNLYIQRLAINEFNEVTSKNTPALRLLPEPAKPTRQSVGYTEFHYSRGRAIYAVLMCFVALILFMCVGANNGSYYIKPGQEVQNDMDAAGVKTWEELMATGKRYERYSMHDKETYEMYRSAKQDQRTMIIVALLFIAGGLLPTVVAWINVKTANAKAEKEEKVQMSRYQESLKSTQSQNTSIRAQYSKDSTTWSTSRTKTQTFMQKKLNETQSVLTKLYSKNTIYPKYQNLAALTSIYEYLKTGRCSELTGPFGAYNLYEDELRKDLIISKLDLIISDLQRIKQNQFMLYQQLTEVQREVSLIHSDLTKIKAYTYEIAYLTELNAYYNGITASNTALIAAYSL